MILNQIPEPLRHLAHAHIESGDAESLLTLMSSDDYCDFLFDNMDSEEPMMPALVFHGWVMHKIERGVDYRWTDLFDVFGHELHQFSDDYTPPDVIYRGISSDCDQGSGISWTADRDTAIWFARRYGEPHLMQMPFDPSIVMFYTNQRNESEFAINTNWIDEDSIIITSI